MRTKKSAINMITAFICQFIVILLGFISRRVMFDSVGVEYLGINGLMNNILTILSLAESGIGVSIIYSLYKPLAENDVQKIKGLMNFYKYTYRALALFTLILGLSIAPFLDKLMKDNTVENSLLIYLLFLFSSVSSYLFSYKVSMNNADQNKYLANIINTVTQILVLVIKVFILYLTKNYILFLTIDIVSNLLKNIIFSKIIDRRYPYLQEKNKVRLDSETKKELFINIKSLFLGKVGYIISTVSDNLVISSFISIKTVGLYSNYTTLVSSVSGFVSIFISSISASVGNLIAKESEEKIYSVFKVTSLINFWLYGFSCICLYCLSEPFITLWLGRQYLMGKKVLLLIVINFMLSGLIAPIDSVKSAAGLYYPDRYVPMIAAIVNMSISIILVKPLGIIGVFIGTLVSTILFSFWIKPVLVYKNIFKKKVSKYFLEMGIKILGIISLCLICDMLGNKVYSSYSILGLLIRMIICIIIPNTIFIAVYYKTDELNYLLNILNSVKSKLNDKIQTKTLEIRGK